MESEGGPTDGDLLRALLARTSDYVHATDRDGRIRFASNALARVLGFDDPAQLTGRLGVELPVGAVDTRIELRDERGEPAGTLALAGAAADSPRADDPDVQANMQHLCAHAMELTGADGAAIALLEGVAQGYFLSRPLPADEIGEWLLRRGSAARLTG